MESEASITNKTESLSSVFGSSLEADSFMEVNSFMQSEPFSPLSSPSTESAKSFSSVTSPCDSLLCSPYIELDEKHFVNNNAMRMLNLYGRHIEANNLKRSGRDAFISHARWLQQNYQELKVARLRLCFSNPSEYTNDAMEWIRMATSRDVEELHIDFSIPDHDRRYPECFKSYAELPPDVYMLRDSLHTLRLSGCKFQPALFGKFSALRKLSIERVEFDRESLQVLVANCWHLEDLKLKMLGHLTNININDFRHRIKRVTIEECIPLMEANIVMPGLQYFRYSGIAVPIVIKDYYTIEEAELDFSQQFELGHHGGLISEILICLQNARVLTVCSYLTRVIGSENLYLPTIIIQLRHLILMKATLHKDESAGIIFLLANYPKLETLTINMGYQTQLAPRILSDEEYNFNTPFDAERFWEAQTSPITCLDMYLKKVNILNFRGHKNEVHFLKYLLKKSARLEELSITITSDMPDWENLQGSCISAAKRLQHCEKASPIVQIAIR
ncbi:putative F-box/LRR-repeat protein At5g54820 [Phoenix dactylifera]|uniref:F-box/LRR-repeat protein At5g54820 n=1 Tax=Phoenix dactylifera TaxID=42345 RepID=A0A8B9AR34_PHODC|nr:putative F-box/LRR-repeat protein At5g54820 [Phoenix dactylifera]